MQSLSPLEALTISHWYALIARALANASTLPDLTVQQNSDLTNLSENIAATSSNLATDALQVTFQDASKAFGEISDAASQAAKTAQQLALDASQVNTLLQIGAKVIALGAAVMTGNYGAAIGDLIGLVGNPIAGQGATDPLVP
jgi:methyl-accepting chemotaxis protein